MAQITKKRLMFDLYWAYQCAISRKTNKEYVKVFHRNLHENLKELCDELYERRYKPSPSTCFIISEPKIREIFAASFRDRIVHHLYYNYTYDLFNRTFIEDSYSCRVGKGTHYGIHRLEKHIRQESDNYNEETYVLKMDIKGYFIHINRQLLLSFVYNDLDKSETKKCFRHLDFDFIRYLSREIILLNPVENCIMKSRQSEWERLDKSKSLFFSGEDCGLPIGNLTSQLFSNVYLNHLDYFVKRELKCKHYGRYVDDFYVVSKDKEFLRYIVKRITEFMRNELNLEIQDKKTRIVNVRHGIDFLGAFVLPHRTYVSKQSLKRMRRGLHNFQVLGTDKDVTFMTNSYLGTFSHYKSNLMKKNEMDKTTRLKEYGNFIGFYDKFM